jgi:hypothetical protein
LFNPGAGDMRHDAGMASGSRHLSERIGRAPAEVYEYASDPANLPHWAPGLGTSVEEAGGQWFVHTPEGRGRLRLRGAQRLRSSRDAGLVAADLARLRELLESR